MNNEVFGKKLAELRKSKNLTQKNLAEKLNVSSKTISKWETGICIPDIYMINDLAKIFDVKIEELVNSNLEEKVNKKKNKKVIYVSSFLFIIIIIISVLVIVQRNTYKTYTIEGKNKNFQISGIVKKKHKESSIIIDNIAFISNTYGTELETKIHSYEVELCNKDKCFFKKNITYDQLNKISIIENEIIFIDTKEDTQNLKLIISYINEKNEEETEIIIIEGVI